MATDKIMVGWFGKVGRTGTNVHIVLNGKVLCSWKPSRNYKFQWCAYGLRMEYVECKKCKERGLRLLNMEECNNGT